MKILNFGSLNIDYTYRLDHIVQEGETITSKALEVFPGGKGLNQSIALAKAGAPIWHAGLIGEDGGLLLRAAEDAGVHTDYIRECPVRSGNAIIQVSDAGNNCIIVFPGSNRENTKEFIDEVISNFEAGDVLVLQNEMNLIDYMIEKAHDAGMKVVLNPSPFDSFIDAVDLNKVDLFMMNEVEGAQIAGTTEPDDIIAKMQKDYPNASVVLTLGEDGAMFSGDGIVAKQPAFKTKAVDTTAAGDTFTGFFLTSWLGGMDPAAALKRASMASSIAVSRKGAASSIPTVAEVDEALAKL